MGDPADWEPADEEDDEDDVCGSDVSEGGAA
jgi:hypothetical protein